MMPPRAPHRAYLLSPAPPPAPRRTHGSPRPLLRNPLRRLSGTRLRGCRRPIPPVFAPVAASRVRSCCSPAIVHHPGGWCRRCRLDWPCVLLLATSRYSIMGASPGFGKFIIQAIRISYNHSIKAAYGTLSPEGLHDGRIGEKLLPRRRKDAAHAARDL